MTSDPDLFHQLIAEAQQIAAKIKTLLPKIVETRRNYARSRSATDEAEMNRVQKIARELSERHSSLYEDLKRASGLPEDLLQAIDQPDFGTDSEDRLMRETLTKEKISISAFVEDHVPNAIDAISRILPKGWLNEQSAISHRLDELTEEGKCLSLVKGLRPESEFSSLHRLRQMLRVAQDYMNGARGFDHFAGSTLVPQLAQLGNKLDHLSNVGGNTQVRLKRLVEESSSVDAGIFELLVAARCVEVGRAVEFIDESQEKSPDLRCHDPFPLVIECKRKRNLSDYELSEERVMRQIFMALERDARTKGIFGRFELRLTVEANDLAIAEIAACMINQPLAMHPESAQNYAWGSVAFMPLSHRIHTSTTRLYSPIMLQEVFDWNSDLPEWDGIVCRVKADTFDINEALNPIALVWNNSSKLAINRRAWSPLDLFGDATNQIPGGEFGIVYLAYHEGARAEIADQRTQRFFHRVKEWEHAGSIRIPISFLIRLYPRPLDHGNPDLIESVARLYSGTYGDPRLFEDFPGSIFTP